MKVNDLLKKLTSHFIRGFLAFLPLIISLYVVILLLKFFWSITGAAVVILPVSLRDSGFVMLVFRVLTAVSFFAVVILLGYWIKGVTGKIIFDRVDAFISSIPAIRVMYGTIRQIIDLLSKKRDSSVMKPAMVEWPAEGRWTIAFVTGTAPMKDGEKKLFTVFVPTSPAPTSGFLLLLPQEKIRPIDIPFEAAMKMVMTAGMVQ
jgi:uncharacterized membrane protein